MDKIRVGVIGCGAISRNRHMPAFAAEPDVELVAVCDVDSGCAKAAAEQFSIPHTCTGYEDLVTRDDIDLVDVCTPNAVHMAPAIAALQAGKHVLLEKPIGRNSKEAQAVVDASRESSGKLMIAQCWRFRPDNQMLKRFIDDGAMGEMYYARVQALRRRGIPGHGTFIDKEKQGGGPLIDLGVHILDCCLWLMGHPKPVSASGVAGAKFGKESPGVAPRGAWDHTRFTIEDFAAGFVRFDNGATLTIESSFAANIEKDTMSLAILGTEGGCQTEPLKVFREEHGTLLDMTPAWLPTVNFYEAEIRAFLDSIQNDTEPPVTGEQALLVSKIVDAIYQSSDLGKEVAID